MFCCIRLLIVTSNTSIAPCWHVHTRHQIWHHNSASLAFRSSQRSNVSYGFNFFSIFEVKSPARNFEMYSWALHLFSLLRPRYIFWNRSDISHLFWKSASYSSFSLVWFLVTLEEASARLILLSPLQCFPASSSGSQETVQRLTS